jgi:hypothetical protein
MKAKVFKVIAQTEAVYVPSRKNENGQVAKSEIRLKEFGGDYEDELMCTMFGNLALLRFDKDDLVIASLRFQTHESNGQTYQDITVTNIVKVKK